MIPLSLGVCEQRLRRGLEPREHEYLSGVGRGSGRKCQPSRPQWSQEWALGGTGPCCPCVLACVVVGAGTDHTFRPE